MTIKPKKVIKLDYKPGFLRAGNAHEFCMTYETKGDQITLFAPDYSPSYKFGVSFTIKSYSSCDVDIKKERIAVVRESEAVCLYDFQGEKISEIAGNYICAAFTNDGSLWGIERAGHELLTWNVFNTDNKLIASFDIKDPMYESHVCFTHCPSGGMILELAAGQDGTALFLLSHKDGILGATEMFPNQCLSCPSFNDDGNRLLVLEYYDETLYHYSYPQLEKLGEYHYERGEEEELGSTLFYAGTDCAVISWNSRYYLLDLIHMTVCGEIIIEGHEPQPANIFYPRLSDDKALMTDIPYLVRIGDVVLGRVDFQEDFTLLVFDVADFEKHHATPQRTRKR